LKESYKLVKQKGYVIGNIDCTVLLEQPKVNPHIEKMQRIIAGLLEVDTDDVSIKATRGEKMGYIGNGKGIQAYCNALIYKP
jgi:2-C-methyl-D-erythritol 2,4-cyclodiphosphate synthase